MKKDKNIPKIDILIHDCCYRERDRDADGDWVFYCEYKENCIYKNKQTIDGFKVTFCDKFS